MTSWSLRARRPGLWRPRVLDIRAWANALGSAGVTPQSGAGADGLTECSREMTLIEEPARFGNLFDGFVGI